MLHIKKYYFFFSAIFCSIQFAQAQDTEVFERLSTKEGLSENVVTGVYQDKKGLLWFGTYDGLNCYDGYHFRVYKHSTKDTLSLPGNHTGSIMQDASKDLWVVTDKGTGILDAATGKFQTIFKEKAALPEEVQLFDAGNDKILFIHAESILLYNKKTKALERIFLPPGKATPYINAAFSFENKIYAVIEGIDEYACCTAVFDDRENTFYPAKELKACRVYALNALCGYSYQYGTSAWTAVGDGNKFIGLNILGTILVQSSVNVVFSRCSLQDVELGNITGFITEDCIIGGAFFVTNVTLTNAIIRNNIWYINGTYGGFYGAGGSTVFSNVLIDHNVINSGYRNIFQDGNPSVTGITFSNNICLNVTLNRGSTAYTYQNNFSNTQNLNLLANSSANIFGADPLFVNYNLDPNLFNFTLDFHLQAASPCKNTGTGGSGDDMGVYSGITPLVWSGEPNIPTITVFNLLGNQFISGSSATIHFESTIVH